MEICPYLKSKIVILFLILFFVSGMNPVNAQLPREVEWLKKINPQQPDSKVAVTITNSVYPVSFGIPVGLLAVGLIKKDKQLQHRGVEMIGSLAINTIITVSFKKIINRDRPYERYPYDIYPHKIYSDRSFPSGHTSTAFSVATTLTLEFKKWYVIVPAYAWAAGVGYSRLYLGAHYPSDVFGGAVIGGGSAFLSHWLSKKLLNHKK